MMNPVQIRIDNNLLKRIKTEARKIAVKKDCDYNWQSLVRDTLLEKFPDEKQN